VHLARSLGADGPLSAIARDRAPRTSARQLPAPFSIDFQDDRSYSLFVPRPRRSQDTRETLLEAGIQLLATRGYNGTGLKEILDVVHVPKGSFYNYFESKEAFGAAIIERYIDDLLAMFDAYVARSQEDPISLIKSVYGYMLVQFAKDGCQRGCLLGNLAAEVGASSALCQAALRGAFARWKQRFVRLLARAQDAGQLRTDVSAANLADIFWNAWEGGILRMKLEGDTTELKHTIELLLDRLFAPAATRRRA
jgi:TetR/AcrR family transcriptional repressor of nem operon